MGTHCCHLPLGNNLFNIYSDHIALSGILIIQVKGLCSVSGVELDAGEGVLGLKGKYLGVRSPPTNLLSSMFSFSNVEHLVFNLAKSDWSLKTG